MNIDQQEVQKFSELAEKWWDENDPAFRLRGCQADLIT